MALETNSNAMVLNTRPSKKKFGKVIISVLLGLLPIALSGSMTFLKMPLSGLLTFGVGTIIGLTLIPFILFITNSDEWKRKWYIWVAISVTILIVFALPMLKSGGGAGAMQGPMNGDIRMENGMY